MASSSVDSTLTGSVTTHPNRSVNSHTNDYRRRYPHANNYNSRRRDGRAGSSRGAGAGGAAGSGHTFGRRNQVPNKKQMMTLDDCKHLLNIAPSRTHHGRIKMEGQITECDICCRESDLFAVGECLHPLCMECGIRLRILSKSDSCPKCRATVDMMYFIPFEGDWSNVSLPSATDCVEHSDCERYKIKFKNEYCVKCYDSYMEHACLICEKKKLFGNNRGEQRVFATFAALSQHVWMVHRFDFCEICVEHLNLLSRERRFYSQLELERHMQSGDTDDKSQKGHPLCLFCEKRFLDDEYRYKHLRKEHFFCQICDADGKLNYFYPHHNDLLHHYKKEHVICEEGDCKQLGIAFRTETELKFHKSRDHAAGPQTLDLDIHFTDRNLGVMSRGGGASSHRRGGGGQGRGGGGSVQRNIPRIGVIPCEQPVPPPRAPEAVEVVIVPSAQNKRVAPSLRYSYAPKFTMTGNDFPRLGAAGPGATSSSTAQGGSRATKYANLGPMGGGAASSLSETSRSSGLTEGQESTSLSSNKKGQLSSSSSARQEQMPASKLSWFIDDDEQMPPHRPNPAVLANMIVDRGSEEDGKDVPMLDREGAQSSKGEVGEVNDHEKKVETSWGGAVIRRPNSLSSIASALNSNAFPSLSSSGNGGGTAAATAAAAQSSAKPKNLPANSAWAKNRLQFSQSSSSSAIVGSYIPSERGGSASAGKKKVLPKPDIWPEENLVPASWEDRDIPEGMESSLQQQENLKPIGKMAKKEVVESSDDKDNTIVGGGGRKKKSKKEKARQQAAQQELKSKQEVKEVIRKEETLSKETKSVEKPRRPTENTAPALKVAEQRKSEPEPFPALSADTTKESAAESGGLSEGMKKSKELLVSEKESPEAVDTSSTPATTTTIATSFSQILSNAFSSLMGSAVGGASGDKNVSSQEKQSSSVVKELRKNSSKKKNWVEQEKIDEESEDFPSLLGGGGTDRKVEKKGDTGISAAESSAWKKGAPELSSASTKVIASEKSMKKPLSPTKSKETSKNISEQSNELRPPSTTTASFTMLPPGLGIGKGTSNAGALALNASGVGAPPGLAPPPGFGPPPGFEAFSSAKKRTSTDKVVSGSTTATTASAQKSKNQRTTVPKKGKN